MQAIKARVISPKGLIDLQHVAELNGIEYKQGAVRIGAMTRYRDIAADERLDGAVRHFAMPRAMSAIVKCAIAARSGQPMLELYRRVYAPDLHWYRSVTGSRQQNGGKRSLRAEEFLQGPLETARGDDEIVVAVDIARAAAILRQCLQEMGSGDRRSARCRGLRVYRAGDDGRCELARLAVGGLATGPRRAKAGEKALIGVSATDASAISEAAETAAASTETQSDMWADAEYRKRLIATLARQVITTAFARATRGKHS